MSYLWAVRVSGGHFNPALTLAVYIKTKTKDSTHGTYAIAAVIMQFLGACLGILFVYLALKDYAFVTTREPTPQITAASFFSTLLGGLDSSFVNN